MLSRFLKIGSNSLFLKPSFCINKTISLKHALTCRKLSISSSDIGATSQKIDTLELSEDLKKTIRFTREHEWAQITSDGLVTVGISGHAAKALGDVVFAEMPKEGCKIRAGDSIGAVESVKAASELYSPVSGVIWKTNHLLDKKPQLIGTHPYCSGWFCKIKFTDERELLKLMNFSDYQKYTEGSEKD